MTLVDSSGWIEFLTDGPLAERYASHLREISRVVTPTLVLYEVYKRIKREATEGHALAAVAQMQKSVLVPLSPSLALSAADVSLEFRLPMADAVVYATALAHHAELVTSDGDFQGLPGVTYIARR